MCGLVAIVDLSSKVLDPSKDSSESGVLGKATRALSHRGPDEETLYNFENVYLGFRRLSIVDIHGGSQPIFNEDRTKGIICNGEIYNYREIRKGLEEKGHRFSTASDTEVILHLYEQDPEGFVKELDGMFAFVILDQVRRKIVFGRDRVGIKPLFISMANNCLILSSEIKAIFASGLISPSILQSSVSDFMLHGYIPGRDTLYNGIQHVEPAAVCELDLTSRQIKERRYWDPSFLKVGEGSLSDALKSASIVREALTSSVSSQTIGDVEIGAYLSGGLDSTLTVNLLKKALKDKYAQSPLKAFSIAFEDDAFDESKVFEETSRTLGLNLQIERIKGATPSEMCEALKIVEQPQISPMDIPMQKLARLVASNNIKVVLSGEGSDEVFGGYEVFTILQIMRGIGLLPMGSLRDLIANRSISRLFGGEKNCEIVRSAYKWHAPIIREKIGFFPSWYPLWLTKYEIAASALKTPIFSNSSQKLTSLCDNFEATTMGKIAREVFEKHRGADEFNLSLALELRTRLPNYILSRADRNSMSHGVELRVPFLSNKMLDACLMLPSLIKGFAFSEKLILKRAFSDILPKHIMKRKKFGYNMSNLSLFRERDEKLDAYLNVAEVKKVGVFEERVISKALSNLRNGGSKNATPEAYESAAVLTSVLAVHSLADSYK